MGPWSDSTTHYPSWGFETGLSCCWCGYSIELITPHGDLKLSMRRVPAGGLARLITPHGDLKQAGMEGCLNHIENSLPLMGI